ncbi:MAG: hypothetical protein RSE18_00950 [Acinetobacter sp.]
MKSKFIELKPSKQHLGRWKPDGLKLKSIKKSLPFLESFRGCYAHRVKHVTMQTFNGKSHFIIKTWCGTSFCNGSKDGKGQTYFVEKPTQNRPICAICEGKFIGSGQSGERTINGNSVMYRPYF